MDLTLSPTEHAFRDEVRAWLEGNSAGPEPRGGGDATFDWRRRWQERLASGGWSGVDWPTEHGGRGATATESAIFFEELARAREPLPANVLGLLLAGPTIMTWGTPAQRDRHLASILTAEEIWCQGFSEPDAGSDLASLKARAVREGDEWVISGQKVWTSAAQHSKWCMLLARSDPDARKHQGITYFLMDMEQEGVEIVPLRQITGEAHFNELFLDGARVPDENVLGGAGNGWKVAMTTLMSERSGLAFFHQVRMRQLLESLLEAASERERLGDPVVARRLGELDGRIEVLRLTAYRGLTSLERNGQPGPESALTKLMWSSTNQMLTQLAVDLLGPEALAADDLWAYELLRARGNSIEGGTTEILKSIAAERVLGLPRGR
ncbi:MAG TPA: acyl-CoA dehydrogenase family protein [Solirubrobacterales bacterium]|jgi:alkylation response protein AidB-like acyl-CoA dehydrogenase